MTDKLEEEQFAFRQAAEALAERLVKEGKIQPHDRARIIRMCKSSASFKATADYYDARPGPHLQAAAALVGATEEEVQEALSKVKK